ncbi:hypothetical protein Tco_0704068 [Tanacetum coccineum]|uniref:Uncharacterized protein n=1 Tax=Tanacetum coccineum TaxID=301880 RepID=A0ABQ4Y218_9ASTR
MNSGTVCALLGTVGEYVMSAMAEPARQHEPQTPSVEWGDHDPDTFSGRNLRTKPAAVRSTILGSRQCDQTVVTTYCLLRYPPVLVPKVTDLNPETLYRVYVPKWTVTNESVLDDPYRCRTLTDQLAPPALFSQLYAMKYDPLYTKFNVGAERQMCLGVEVRMREKHTLRNKKILEEECAQQTNLLKEKNAKIASLKNSKECVLLRKVLRSGSSDKSGLLMQVSSLETTCAKLRNQVVGYEFFKEQIAAIQDRSKSLLRRLW